MCVKRYFYKGFYGDYGHITEHNNGSAVLEMYANGKRFHHKRYKTLRGAKIALGRFSDSYTITKVV